MVGFNSRVAFQCGKERHVHTTRLDFKGKNHLIYMSERCKDLKVLFQAVETHCLWLVMFRINFHTAVNLIESFLYRHTQRFSYMVC